MDERQLTQGLALLADEAEPAPVDVAAVITAAKARRHRKVSVATAFATVVVIGTLAITLGGDNRTSPTDDTEQSTTSAPPTLREIKNERSAQLTDQLVTAWPSITPFGVIEEPSPWYPNQEPLVFLGQQYGRDVHGYMATASLVDAEGRTQFMISTSTPDDPTISSFKPCTPAMGCTYHKLSDGTQVNVVVQPTAGTGEVTTTLDVLRPNDLRYQVMEQNSYPEQLATDTRATPIFSVEELLKFATVLS